MERITAIAINKRIAKGWGTRAAAVFGWIFAQCQAQVPREECKRTECGRGVYRKTVRVRISCCELGRLLHLSRHTVEAILHRLEADGIIDVWLPRGEDRTRAYSIATKGFTLLHRWAGEWHTNDEGLSFWGLDTRVASRVGVNAAIVFQYLWLWSTGWSWGGHYTKDGRAWLPYTAAELSRWLPFLSDDVVEEALHTLEAAGMLARMRQGRVTKWAASDAGFAAMGKTPPVQYEARAHTDDAGFSAMGKMPPVRYADAAYMGEIPPVRGEESMRAQTPVRYEDTAYMGDTSTRLEAALRGRLPASQKDEHLAAVSQELSVPLEHWRLEKRRGYKRRRVTPAGRFLL